MRLQVLAMVTTRRRTFLHVLLLLCTVVIVIADERMEAIVRERLELMHTASNLLGIQSLRTTSPVDKFLSAITLHTAAHAKRGIVFPAGTSKQLANAYIGASMIRKLGCSLPIDIAVYGSEERPDAYHAELLKVTSGPAASEQMSTSDILL